MGKFNIDGQLNSDTEVNTKRVGNTNGNTTSKSNVSDNIDGDNASNTYGNVKSNIETDGNIASNINSNIKGNTSVDSDGKHKIVKQSKTKSKVSVQVYMDISTKQDLDKLCKQAGINRNEMINDLLRYAIDKTEVVVE